MAKYNSINIEECSLHSIFEIILCRKVDEATNYEDLLDIMQECLLKTFHYYYAHKVRTEADTISRGLKINFCQNCFRKTEKISLHHIIPVSSFGGNEPENLIFLCEECHKKTMNNKYRGKILNLKKCI